MASTTGVISGSIKWTGLASGTDFASVVDKLVAIEQRTITRQETWKAEWQSKIQAISDLNTRLVSLKLDAQSKDIRSELLSRSSSVSDESVMSVINTSTAPLGSYEVTVGTKIQEKLASHSFTDGTTFGTAGETLEIQIGEDPDSILVIDFVDLADLDEPYEMEAGATLEQIATFINDRVSTMTPPMNVGISAEVINDKPDGATFTKRLVLTAAEGGTANKINVITDLPGLDLTKTYIDAPVNTTILGSTAKVTVDTSKEYLGDVNKTVTFAIGNTGTLGKDDIVINWADTAGNNGKFTIIASEYNADNNKLYEVTQGLTISFAGPSSSTPGMFIKAESFTIDCQAPILQKGQDSGVAQTAKLVHSGFVDQISPIHTGTATTFAYTYRGVKYSVNVTDKMSLGNLASAINDASDNPGVTATIVNDGQGTSTSCHLVLTGNHTGADSAITVEESVPPILNFDTSATAFTVSREATNAMVKVDGFPSDADTWIQRYSNEISDIIEGSVFTIKSTGSSTLTVSNDPTAMRDKINQLVQSVNFCKTYIVENTKWGESNLEVSMNEGGEIVTSRETENGLMIGNYGFQISQTILDNFMNSNLVPLSENPELSTKEKMEKRQKYYDDNGLIYTTLADIGITSDPDNQGLYKVEESKLLTCIQQNPEAVIKLFTFSDEYTDIGRDGKSKQVKVRGLCVGLSADMELLTSTTDITDENGDVVQQGKGIMVTLQENYEGIIENINAKIAREERRIEAVRQRYTDRFNRLEVALQQLQDKQTQLESSLSSLQSNSSGD
ncbi:MAG: flagellar filament capping protein FliD [Deltaproteobacteria bacterium]|jgi:flagellar hook-associated protein 2|nr:flagellar filament capping protein FliD [Deltaproteobacteria bacterium]